MAAKQGFKHYDEEPKNEKEAVRLWEASCKGGNTMGCTGLAIGFIWGLGGKTKDYGKARELLDPACEKGTMRACSLMGQINYFAWGVPKDIDRARAFWQKACDGGEPRGCYLLGIAYRAKDGPAAWHDETAGENLLRKACDSGYKKACDEIKVIDRVKTLKAKVRRKYYDEETDAECTGKGLPPYRWDYEGGTYDENETVALAEDCKHLYGEHNKGTPNWNTYCCSQKPTTF